MYSKLPSNDAISKYSISDMGFKAISFPRYSAGEFYHFILFAVVIAEDFLLFRGVGMIFFMRGPK